MCSSFFFAPQTVQTQYIWKNKKTILTFALNFQLCSFQNKTKKEIKCLKSVRWWLLDFQSYYFSMDADNEVTNVSFV